MPERTLNFIKKETVLVVSFFAAFISALFVIPDKEYLTYIDLKVIATLFCLMVAVEGFNECGLLKISSQKLISKMDNTKQTAFVLILLCFFSSLFITNDVALLTFVPVTIKIFEGYDEKYIIKTVVMETVSANLGSCATPVGNPQNLYLFSHYEMQIKTFFQIILPVAALGLLLIMLISFFTFKKDAVRQYNEAFNVDKKKSILFSLLFLICILSVARVIDYRICLVTTIILVSVFSRKVLKNVDYALLATFVCFFVFVGNIGRIDIVNSIIKSFINGREYLTSIFISQFISNVPAAVMLSNFTGDVVSLLKGTNIGGLGTIVASLASLISYKIYSKRAKAQKGKYLLYFSLVNFSMLFVLSLLFYYI